MINLCLLNLNYLLSVSGVPISLSAHKMLFTTGHPESSRNGNTPKETRTLPRRERKNGKVMWYKV